VSAREPSWEAAVPSRVLRPGTAPHEDRNGFVTALGIRALRRSGRPVPPGMLDVLEACRHPGGGFGFWPPDVAPPWAGRLGADSDDTAVMAVELLLAGRLTRDQVRTLAYRTVARHRLVLPPDPGPPWLAPGVFTTWHAPDRLTDVVDLAAVVNVLALLAVVDLLHLPGVARSVEVVRAAVAWAGDSRSRWTSLCPFYPEPEELALAADHALDCAPGDLAGLALVAERARSAAPRPPEAADVVCSSPYGHVVWESHALTALRSAGLPHVDGVRRPPARQRVGELDDVGDDAVEHVLEQLDERRVGRVVGPEAEHPARPEEPGGGP
jgi:hypothetical protein